jgi:hypothetical protein
MDADYFLEEQLDRRGIAELALNEDAGTGVEVPGARHAQVLGDVRLSPNMDFSKTGVMKAPEARQESFEVVRCLKWEPSHSVRV